MGGVSGLCSLPILVSKAEHVLATFRHVSVQAGVQGYKGMTWMGPLRFLGSQLGILLFYWFVVWVWAMIAHRTWRRAPESASNANEAGTQYLWWMSAPMFGMFL